MPKKIVIIIVFQFNVSFSLVQNFCKWVVKLDFPIIVGIFMSTQPKGMGVYILALV